MKRRFSKILLAVVLVSTVMLISGLNHDADAIAYQRYQLESRGVSVVNV
jgi:hypothetical protein